MEYYKLILLLTPTAITFLLYGLDKLLAKLHARRIPERVLILAAVLGGSIGALLGMFVFRHKVRKPKFYIGIPVILLLQIALCIGLIWFWHRYLSAVFIFA